MKRAILLFALGLCFFSLSNADADVSGSNAVVRIDINSAWGGLGNARETKVAILHTPDGYRLNDVPVPDGAVNNLMKAMQEPALGEANPANLGIDQAWLDAHSSLERINDSRLIGRSPEQLALYKTWFTDPSIVGRAVADIYSLRSYHTDDYPSLTATVTFENGSTAVIESLSQPAFMLPWSITVNGHGTTITYDADISRAISALLPPGATNGGRVSGAGLADELSGQLLYKIEDDWNLLDAQSRVPATIGLLKAAYDVRSAKIDDRNSIAYFSSGEGAQSDVFDAILSRRGFPKNLTVALELPFENGKVEGAGRFLKTETARENLVLSVNWLMAAFRHHPEFVAQLAYVNGASLSEEAFASFAADMHSLGKDSLAAEVSPVRSDSVLLMSGVWRDAKWIVLPDRRVVVWRYREDETPLDGVTINFPVNPCAKSASFFGNGGCVGVVISPAGRVVK